MKNQRLGWIIAGAIVIVLALGGGVTAIVLASGGDPTTVQEVADEAVEAAKDLDVDAGIDLLCEAPPKEDREGLQKLIEAAQDKADTDDPEVDYEISDVDGDTEGSFEVRITSSEPDLDDEELAYKVTVKQDGDRSCISDYEALD